MNRIYKVIYSKVKHQYVVVSELAKNHSKDKSSSVHAGGVKTMLASLAASLLVAGAFAPVTYAAVTPTAGNEGSVVTNGTTTSVYIQQLMKDKNAGVNRFDAFDVAKDNVANIYFHQNGGNTEIGNVVNVVRSKINVDGTVNAIHNNAIGGNLYFLSSSGMAVGPTGVINAGSVTALTPTHAAMNYLLLDEYKNDTKYVDAVINNPGGIPLNQKGDITIQGKINATDGIMLRSGNTINISKAENATSAPSLKTGVTDFTDLVNTTEITGEMLKATKSGNGDIVIGALAVGPNATTDVTDLVSSSAKANIKVGEGAIIDAGTGNVKMTASALSSGRYLNDDAVTYAEELADAFSGDTVYSQRPTFSMDLDANITVDGSVKGSAVTVGAEAVHIIKDTEKFGDTLVQIGERFAGLPSDYYVNGADQNNYATVTVGKTGSLTATGVSGDEANDLTIDAKGTLKTEMGTYATAGIIFDAVDNYATVNMNGQAVAEQGDVSIDADANSNMLLIGVVNPPTDGSSNKIVVGSAVIVNADTHAAVNVGDEAVVKSTNGNVDVNADTTTSLFLKTATTSKGADDGDFTAIGTAISYVDFDGSAKVNVGEKAIIVGQKDVSITAKDNVKRNYIRTINSVGDTNAVTTEDVKGSESSINQAANLITNVDFVNTIKGIVKTIVGTDEVSDKSTGLAMAQTGAAVTLALEKFEAAVNVGNNATLTAKQGNLTVGAEVSDPNTLISTTANNYLNENQADADYDVSGAVSYTKLTHTSQVNVGTDAKMTAGKDLSVTATTTTPYERPYQMALDVLDALELLIQAAEDTLTGEELAKVLKDLKTIKSQTQEIANAGSAQADPTEGTGTIEENLTAPVVERAQYVDEISHTLVDLENALKLKKLQIAGFILNDFLNNFLDSGSYANINVRTSTRENLTNVKKTTETAVTGAINISNVTNGSKVIVGKNAALQAGTADDITVNSTTSGSILSITGNSAALTYQKVAEAIKNQETKDLFNFDGVTTNGSGYGINMSIQGRNSYADTLVAEGVTIAGQNVDVTANNRLIDTGIVFGSTFGGVTSVAMNGALHYGDSMAVALVDDEAVLTAGNAVTIQADNTTTVTNVVGALARTNDKEEESEKWDGENKAAGVGITINWMDTDTNAGIIDIDSDTEVDDVSDIEKEKAIVAGRKARAAALAKLSESDKALLGTQDTEKQGSVSAKSIDIEANASGVINAVGAGVSLAKADPTSGLDTSDDDAVQSAWDEQQSNLSSDLESNSEGSSLYSNILDSEMGSMLDPLQSMLYGEAIGDTTSTIGDLQGETQYFLSEYMNLDGSDSLPVVPAIKNPFNNEGASDPQKPYSPDTHFSASYAGSVGVNVISGQTAALANGTNMTLTGGEDDSNAVRVAASDDSFVGAWAGSAALNWAKTDEITTSKKETGTAAGALAINYLNRDVTAVMADTEVDGAKTIDTLAFNSGADVAIGLGGAYSEGKTDETAAENSVMTMGLSWNRINTDTSALMVNNTVNGQDNRKTKVTVDADTSKVQVTGGVNAAIALNGDGVSANGGSIAIGNITNYITAGIIDGTYQKVSDLDVIAGVGTTQITAAVGASVSKKNDSASASDTDSTANQFAFAYSEIDNDAKAIIRDTSITASGTVNAEALDTRTDINKYATYLENRGIDATGDTYKDVVTASENEEYEVESAAEDKNYQDKLKNDTGNALIIGAAISFDMTEGSDGSSGIGGGFLMEKIQNEREAAISNATITAKNVQADALNDTTAIGLASGISLGNDISGAGSLSLQSMTNKTIASMTDAQIKADTVSMQAKNDSLNVNVGGQLTEGNMALGLVGVVNLLDTETGTYIKGGSIEAMNDESSVATSLKAENDSDLYAIGLGVTTGDGKFAVNGTFAGNFVTNQTEALIETDDNGKGTTISSAREVLVEAEDKNVSVAGVGGVQYKNEGGIAASTVAAGAAAAVNVIGTGANPQSVKAEIRNATIETADNATDSSVKVSAKDTSHLVTAAVAAGLVLEDDGTVAEGAAASTVVHKAVTAAISQSDIQAPTAAVNVQANNDTLIVNTADVAAINLDGVAGGGAIAVNTIDEDTTASVEGGTLTADSLEVNAESTPDIYNIAVGAAIASGNDAAGSVSVNIIDNDVKANISDSAQAKTTGTTTVKAKSEDGIHNYGGAAGIAGGTVGLGISFTYNELSGDTKALVSDSTLTNKGLTVDADSKRDLDNIVISAGVSREGDITILGGAIALNGDVNRINGTTEAAVEKTDVNKEADLDSTGDITIHATDHTDSASGVGTLAVSVTGEGDALAAGAAVDTLFMNRTVTARLEGDAENKSTVNGQKIEVKAKQTADVLTSADGIAVSVGDANETATGVASAALLTGKTTATVKNISSENTELSVKAEHKHNATTVMVGVGVGGGEGGLAAGAAVEVMNDNSETKAELSDSEITSSGNVTVDAKSTTDVDIVGVDVNAEIAMGAAMGANVGVNNFNSTTSALVNNSTIAADGDFTVHAKDKVDMDFTAVGVNGSLAGVGVSVNVNEVNTGVVAQVKDSQIGAATATVKAEETVDVNSVGVEAAGGAGGLATNVLVTSIGSKEAANYSYTQDEGTFAVSDIITAVDKEILTKTDNAQTDLNEKKTGLTVSNGSTAANTATDGAGVQTLIQNSDITTEKTVEDGTTTYGDAAVSAERTTNATLNAGGGTIGAAAINVTVASLDVTNQTGVTVAQSNITADNLTINAKQDGTAYVQSVQAGGGFGAANVAVALADTHGTNAISVTDSNLTAQSAMQLQAKDTTTTEVFATGWNVAGVAVGAIIANTNNDSTTTVTLDGSNQEQKLQAETISVQAEKDNTVTTTATGGATGPASGFGVQAYAKDSGSASVQVLGSQNTVTANSADFHASNTPKVKAKAWAGAAGLLGVQAVNALAELKDKAILDVAAGNTFAVDTLSFGADVGAESKNKTAKADVDIMGGSLSLAGVTANDAEAVTDTTVTVHVGEQQYSDTTNLTVTGENNVERSSDAAFLTIGMGVATGTLHSTTDGSDVINVTADGGTVQNVTVTAIGNTEANNDADGNGGGVLDISPVSAKANNYIKTDTTATMTGTWNADDVQLKAIQHDTSTMTVDSTHYTGVGGGGIQGITEIGSKTTEGGTKASLTGATITAGTMDVSANNRLDTNTQMDGEIFGVSDMQTVTAEQTVDMYAKVAIDGQTTVQTSGEQVYAAGTTGLLETDVNGQSAGVIDGAFVSAEHDVTVTNAVTSAGTLVNDGDYENGGITMASYDAVTQDLDATSDTDFGAVEAATARVTETMTRNNTIDLSGGSVSSAKDLNLYAGATEDGVAGKADVTMSATAYNHSVIPVKTDPKAELDITENNEVKIADGVTGEAVRHVNIIADGGTTSVKKETVAYRLYTGTDDNVDYIGSSAGETSENISKNNTVDVKGTLKAGKQNKVDITISGDVLPEGLVNEKGTQGQLNIQPGENTDEKIAANIKTGTMDYGTQLMSRWTELKQLIADYKVADSDDEQLSAYLGYKQELAYLEDQLDRMGLMTEITDEKTGITSRMPLIDDVKVAYVELPDLVSSGGNINIQTDVLKGSGTLIAQGAPEITVTNTSSAYLKVNDAIIGETGGEIHFNSSAVTKNDEINAENEKSKRYDTSSNLTLSADAEEKVPAITITNEYSGSIKARKEGSEEEYTTYTPISSVEINGSVNNVVGTVDIVNNSGDVLLRSLTSDKVAEVNGKSVTIKASGDISQGYVDGIINIGDDPQSTYAQMAAESKDATGISKNMENKWHEDTASAVETGAGGTRIAGGNIYLAASNINVNGLIQSGYEGYQATIEQSDIDACQVPANQVLVQDRVMYKVNAGGTVQKDGQYVYEIPVYYDPQTDSLYVEDIDTKGGSIYLAGRISSTGNGQILAADGGADITIVNNTGKELNVGKILNNDLQGTITITDTAQNKQTVYTKDETTVINNYTDYLKASEAEKVNYLQTSETDANASYQVQEGLRYNWTEGTTTGTKATYQNDVRGGLWGAWETKNTTALKEYEQTQTDVQPETLTNEPLSNGAYIGANADAEAVLAWLRQFESDEEKAKLDEMNYVLLADNSILEASRSDVEQWTTWSGFLNWFKTVHYRWTTETSSKQTYIHSVKADHDIGIGFIGKENGNISVSSGGDVNLTNTIQSHTDQSTLSVKSNAGTITQNSGVNVNANDVTLNADTGISGINLVSMNTSDSENSDLVKINAVTNSGDIDINVSGGIVNGSSLAGNVEIVGLKVADGEGTVALTSTGNMTQSGTDTTVQGKRIDLISTNGTIGTAEQAIVVKAGQQAEGDDSLSASLNAQALGDINLAQSEGDMRIGTIKSENGDVTLTATDGYFLDATPENDDDNNFTTAMKIEKWIEDGQVSDVEGSETATAIKAKWAQAVTDYEEKVKADFASMDKDSELFKQSFGDYESAEAFLKAQADDSTSQYAKLLAKRDQYENAQWTTEQLLYAVNDAISNKAVGSTDSNKAANVFGNNITLTGKGVGLNKDESTVIQVDGLINRIDDLKKLANAEYSDVQRGVDENGDSVFIIGGAVPLGLSASGLITIKTDPGEDVYIAGRSDDKDTPSAMNIANINTGSGENRGDVRILAHGGVYDLDQTETNITANNLLIEGGSEDIGLSDNYLTVDLLGDLTARTDTNVYIKSAKELKVDGSYAGETMNLTSDTGITMGSDSSAYLQAGEAINLKTDGYIGTEDEAVRILANGAVVNIGGVTEDGVENAYVEGKLGTNEEGTLVIGDAAVDNTLAVSSDDDVKFGVSDTDDDDTDTSVTSTVTAKTLTVNANGDVVLENGTITTENASLTAGGSIAQTAEHELHVSDTTVLTAGNGIDLVSGAETEDNSNRNKLNDVTILQTGETADVKVISANGDADSSLDVTFAEGSVGKDITIKNVTEGEVTDMSISGPVNAAGDVVFVNEEGDVTVNSDVEAGNDVTITSEDGDVDVNGDVSADNDATITSKDGDVTVDGNVDAGSDATIGTETGDVKVSGDVSADNDVTISTETGDVNVSGDVSADNNASITSKDGNVTVDGNVDAGYDAIISTETGDVNVSGDVSADNNASITSKDGNVTVDGNVDAGKDATISTETGNVDVNGDVSADNDVTISTETGDVNVSGDVSADNNASITSKDGNVTVDGNVDAGNNATISTETGDVDVSGNVKANHDVDLSAETGNVKVDGTVNAGHDVDVETNRGNIDLNGSITAGNDITAETKTKGNITLDGNLQAGHDITLDSKQEGSVVLHDSVTATNDINIHANNGDILFVGTEDGKTEDIVVTAKNGDANISLTGTGDIKDTHRSENGDRGFVKAENGNASVIHTGTGDIDLYGISAKDTATASAADGNVTVDTISGDTATVIVRNPDKKMDVETIEAGHQVNISGADMDITRIQQKTDADGTLHITPNGATDDVPIEKMNIGDIQTNDNVVHFTHLWLRNGSIHNSSGTLELDNLYILDKATFSNSQFVTNVWGRDPEIDKNANSAYWINTSINNPKDYLTEWMASPRTGSRWMYLRFDGQKRVQDSNGNLLDLDRDYRVNNQRYTLTNQMRMMMDTDFYESREDDDETPLSYYNRYDLTEEQSQLQTENAKAEEVKMDN